MHPWAAIVIRFSAVKQIARAQLARDAENKPRKLVHAAVDLDEVLGQRLVEHHLGISRRAIVADFGVIRAFLGIHPLHKLRDDGVHVRVALAMRVRRQVQRHAVDENGEVRAVVEIEAAQKILVGFAAAGVLRDDQAGKRLQNLSRAKKRTILEFLCAYRYLASGTGDSDQVIRAALHVDGGAHGAHSQRDAQRGRRLGGPHGDGDFFGFKTGIRNDEPIITRREPRDHEGSVAVRLRRSQCRSRFEPARSRRQSPRQTYQRQFLKRRRHRARLHAPATPQKAQRG